jgi:hypothetical protein
MLSYHHERRIVTARRRGDLDILWAAARVRMATRYGLWAFLAFAGLVASHFDKIDVSALLQ